MIHSRFFSLLLLCAVLLPPTACVRNKKMVSVPVEALHSGDLGDLAEEGIPRVIFVSIRGMTESSPTLRRQIERELLRQGFEVTDTPSQAGYILQLSILASGQVAPESLRSTVDAGYDAPVRFSGEGASGVVADALLVQRRVPVAGRPERVHLKNISHRNAVGSGQLRVGLLRRTDRTAEDGAFVEALARELGQVVRASAEQSKR